VSSPEEIAREAALALVRFRDPHDFSHDFGDGNQWAQLVVAGRHVHSDWYTAGQREDLRDAVAAAVLAAVQRALASAPVPGGLSEGRLAEIRDWHARRSIESPALHPKTLQRMADLLAHVEHLTRALTDCGADGTAKIWSSGYGAGYPAGRAEGVEAERQRCARLAARMGLDYPTSCRGGDTIARAIREGGRVE
jgi:hypothetical protein